MDHARQAADGVASCQPASDESLAADTMVHEAEAHALGRAPKKLPADFVAFLEANGVPLEPYQAAIFGEPPPRYIRINPRRALGSTETIAASLGLAAEEAKLARVDWLGEAPWAHLYACAASVNLSRAPGYREATLYGVDAASIFAVACLDPQPGDHVLDLCCAPGAKLCAIGDAVSPGGSVIGVDLSKPRLEACRTVVKKYGVPEVRLSLGDGGSWEPLGAEWLDMAPPRGRGQRGRKRKLEAAGAGAPPAAPAPERFDRVLVDAECTHDGSLRHIDKYRTQWGWETLGERVPWVRQEPGLRELQGRLLANGFRLLRDGGVLVYSTCSLCRSQNEDVVAAFLRESPGAKLDALPLPLKSHGVHGAPARPSLLETEPVGHAGRYCTARFDQGSTSGLFVARLRKLPTD